MMLFSSKTASRKGILLSFCCLLLVLCSFLAAEQKPVLYIIGDSTVQNSDGNGNNAYWGWGTLLKPYLDTQRITLKNHAKPGASTRTFITGGRWAPVLDALKPGDFVLIQFGHNDQAVINDTARAKGTLKGLGEDTAQIFNLKTKQREVVHTYGWYMRQYIREIKEKGAIPIVCSLVPRSKWKEGKVDKEQKYVDWARETAQTMGAYYIDLNGIIAGKWEQMGKESVSKFFPGDNTHTNQGGAGYNASCVVEGLMALKDCPLNKFVARTTLQ